MDKSGAFKKFIMRTASVKLLVISALLIMPTSHGHEREERNSGGWNWNTIGMAAVGGGLAVVGGPVLVAGALSTAGFASGGVVAGSIAAGTQATIGNVVAGSTFAGKYTCIFARKSILIKSETLKRQHSKALQQRDWPKGP